MKKSLYVLSGTALALLVSACGGGGGGIVGPSSTVPPVAKATITSGNAQAVAGRSADAALQSGAFGDVIGTVGLTATSSGDVAKVGVASVSRKTGVNVITLQVPVGPETTLCAVDGSVTISGDIANPATITPGDFFDVDWDNCNGGLGQIVDGLLGMTFTSFSGDLFSGQALLGMSLRVADFQVTQGANFSYADGELSLTIDTLTPPFNVATTSGDSFTVRSNDNTGTLSDFSSMLTEDTSLFPSGFEMEAMGTITSSQFTGSVSYETPEPFLSFGDAYPYDGELLVTGADDATVRLIAVDDVNVTIEADYDGDTVVDEMFDTTWDALLNR